MCAKKPSYQILDELINKEWQTNFDIETEKDHLYFKAFYGKYEVTAEKNGKKVTRDLHLTKKGYDEFDFEVE